MFAANHKNDNTSPNDTCCAAEQAGRKVRALIDTATHDARDAIASTEKQIRSNPVQSSLIAVAAGFVLGALLRRK